MTSKALIGACAVFTKRRVNMSVRHVSAYAQRPGYAFIGLGGSYRVSGTVAVAGSPDVLVSRPVLLFSKDDFLVKMRRQSAADGKYDFKNVPLGPWFVVAFDTNGEYNAVIADNILGTPV